MVRAVLSEMAVAVTSLQLLDVVWCSAVGVVFVVCEMEL